MEDFKLICTWTIIGIVLIETVVQTAKLRSAAQFKDTLVNAFMGLTSFLFSLLFRVVILGIYFVVHEWAIFEIGFQWWAWLILALASDLTFYWFHRLSHEWRVLWAGHVVHHSSQEFNFSVAFRNSMITILYRFMFWIPLCWLGFHPLMIVSIHGLGFMYTFFCHTRYIGKLGWFEYVFNTPSHHRVHHASNPEYIDRNYGGVLIIWDRLFGTFANESKRPRYGLVHNIKTYNPIAVLLHEWRDMIKDLNATGSRSARLRMLFKAPDWKPQSKL